MVSHSSSTFPVLHSQLALVGDVISMCLAWEERPIEAQHNTGGLVCNQILIKLGWCMHAAPSEDALPKD